MDVLSEDTSGRSDTNHTEAAAGRWAEQYGNEKVATLGDDDYQYFGWLGVNGFPWLMMVDENMVITDFDSRSNNVKPLDTLEAMVASGEIGSGK